MKNIWTSHFLELRFSISLGIPHKWCTTLVLTLRCTKELAIVTRRTHDSADWPEYLGGLIKQEPTNPQNYAYLVKKSGLFL